MTQQGPVEVLLQQMEAGDLPCREVPAPGLQPARLLLVRREDWASLAALASQAGWRWAAGWADGSGGSDAAFEVNACLEHSGTYLLARTTLPPADPALPSQTPHFPGADRPERHTSDLFGVRFEGHPDRRRWTRHQAWKDTEHPLRRDFPRAGRSAAPTAGDHLYDFVSAHGSSVYEIPVGPVHAGIIEPGHFRFQAVGESILNLEERLGYTHKGIEKIAEGRDAPALARLAGRVSGDCTVAHAWAACMAMERAAGMAIPARAIRLRALMCERERVANHLGDIGAMLNDIAFAFGFYQFSRLREDWQRRSGEAFGHRFMMDGIVPGGVSADLAEQQRTAMRSEAAMLRGELGRLMSIINDLPSVADRVRGTGILKPELARRLGCVGFVGRASGMTFDVRSGAPYPPYDRLRVAVPVHHFGDVNSRARTRLEEISASLDLIEALLDDLPNGAPCTAWQPPAGGAEGLGMVEGWRGEIVTYVRFDTAGKIARFFPRDPSWTTWPALALLMHDNIVPDFPICNKSVNGSYSGHDL